MHILDEKNFECYLKCLINENSLFLKLLWRSYSFIAEPSRIENTSCPDALSKPLQLSLIIPNKKQYIEHIITDFTSNRRISMGIYFHTRTWSSEDYESSEARHSVSILRYLSELLSTRSIDPSWAI